MAVVAAVFSFDESLSGSGTEPERTLILTRGLGAGNKSPPKITWRVVHQKGPSTARQQ